MGVLHQDYKSFWRTTPVLIHRLLRALHPAQAESKDEDKSLIEYLRGGA